MKGKSSNADASRLRQEKYGRRIHQSEFGGRIGISRCDITPPVGIYLKVWGSASKDVADGVHMPLTATCWTFEDDQAAEELVLICADVMIFWQEEATRIRNGILRTLSLRPEQLIIHPSHSHSTPMLARRHKSRPGGGLIEPYLNSLPSTFIDLIIRARETSQRAVLGWAYGKCGLAYNRDCKDVETGREVCGLNPLETVDDSLLVGRATNSSGHVLGTIVNYACHPVSMGGANTKLSPDYPGVMRTIVEREVGGICTFLHGASGDTTPRRSYEASLSAAEQNGRELGFAVLSVLSSMVPPEQDLKFQKIEESGAALGIWSLTKAEHTDHALTGERIGIRLPVRADIPTRQEIAKMLQVCATAYERERLERDLARREIVGDAAEGDFEVAVWRIGGAFLVSSSAEAYSDFQKKVRDKCNGLPVAILNASDGSMGYLPSQDAYKRNVYQVKAAMFGVGSLEIVTEAVTRTIESMWKLGT